jgi:hypothetical protein
VVDGAISTFCTHEKLTSLARGVASVGVGPLRVSRKG